MEETEVEEARYDETSPVAIALKSGALPVHVATSVKWLRDHVEGLFDRCEALETRAARLEAKAATLEAALQAIGSPAAPSPTAEELAAQGLAMREFTGGETPVLPVGKRRTPAAAEPADAGTADATAA